MSFASPARRLYAGAALILLALGLAWGPLLLERYSLSQWQLPGSLPNEVPGASPSPIPGVLSPAQEAELLRRAQAEPSTRSSLPHEEDSEAPPSQSLSALPLRTVDVVSFLDVVSTADALWLLEPAGLWRYRPALEQLAPVSLPAMPPGSRLRALGTGPSGVWISYEGQVGQGGVIQLDPVSLQARHLPLRNRVTTLTQAASGMLALTDQQELLRLRLDAGLRVDVEPLELPAALRALPLKDVVSRGEALYLLTHAGAIWEGTPSETAAGSAIWNELLPPPPVGPGIELFAAAPATQGVAAGLVLSSPSAGLLFWSPGGENRSSVVEPGALPVRSGVLRVLDSAARYLHLAVVPERPSALGSASLGSASLGSAGRVPSVWGFDPSGLSRYNAQLERRVKYLGGLSEGSSGKAPASNPGSGGTGLEGLRRLLADDSGLWLLARDRLSRFVLSDLSMRPRLLATGERSGTPASDAEIEASLSLIAAKPPHERRAAYLALLEMTQKRYDEVFLVGLNESDAETLDVVVEYFRTHHPRAAIEPLLDVLLTLQADAARRRHLVQVLTRFGQPVIGPVATRMQEENPQALESGAGEALEQILVKVVEQGGPELLNRFLETSSPEFLYRYGAADDEGGSPGAAEAPPPVTGETFTLLAARLKRATDPLEIEALLRIIGRLVRTPVLPPEVEALVPALMARLDGPLRRYALYALALLPDDRAVGACGRVFEQDPDLRFWALQALAGVASGETLQPVLLALSDPQPEIRLAAAALVGLEMIPEGAPVLRRMLLEEEQGLCIPCVESLMALRDPLARPVLLARLPSARREEQALILRALTGMGDPSLAQAVAGWLELEILGPVRAGRLSLADGPAQGVLRDGLALIALHAGLEAPGLIQGLTAGIWPGANAARIATLKARALVLNGLYTKLGLSGAIEAAFLSSQAGGTVQPDSEDMRSALFHLIPMAARADTGAVLGALLNLPGPLSWQEEAARALWLLKDPTTLPVLTQALQHPRFVPGPFPAFRFPVRLLAARALERLGVRVERRADRSIVRR